MKLFVVVILVIVIVVPLALALLVNFTFSGEDQSQYDLPKHVATMGQGQESDAHREMAALIVKDMAEAPKLGREKQLKLMREQMDARGAAFEITAKTVAVNSDEVKGEWVLAPNANPDHRLLYIHGGAYMVGSPTSHRQITSRLSELTGYAVFAVDQRLLPEDSRMDGINDCRAAYSWLLENGPNGAAKAQALVLVGDSSGGNLALSVAAWARDENLQAADAVVAMSPQTDLTLSSPSLVANTATDIMQGASFGPIVKAPKVLRLGFSYMMHRIKPNDPVVSPLLGNLSNLPPTLVQISTAEMFYDDGARYVNKANAQGSIAELQVWPYAMHVWHAFDVPEADEAFENIGKFIERHARSR